MTVLEGGSGAGAQPLRGTVRSPSQGAGAGMICAVLTLLFALSPAPSTASMHKDSGHSSS